MAERETNIDQRNILTRDNTHYDNKSVITAASKLTKGTLRAVEERNPYRFIEQALMQAKERLARMKGTPTIIESMTDNEGKKRYLKNENKQLRDQLKTMSDSVNQLIEKMNHEALRRKKYLGSNPHSTIGTAGGITNDASSMAAYS